MVLQSSTIILDDPVQWKQDPVKTTDPTTRRFIREATLGLILVVGLLSVILIGLARRHGVLIKTPQAGDIQLAQVYRRVTGSEGETEASTVLTPPPRVAQLDSPLHPQTEPSGSRNPASNGLLAAEPPASPVQNSGSIASPASIPAIDETTALGERQSEGPMRTPRPRRSPSPSLAGPTEPDSTLRSTPDPESEYVPTPFRSVPVRPAAAGLNPPSGSVERNPRDDMPVPDPKWILRIDDTLWTYCDRNYGDPQWFLAVDASLKERGLDFETLGVGRVLKPPTQAELRERFPEKVPGVRASRPARTWGAGAADSAEGVYVTAGNESLFQIAARLLGQASRYVELVELNASRLPDPTDHAAPLPPGIELRLPPR